MFTGIIETTAKVIEKGASGLIVERPANFDDLKTGSSIAVNGTCLTAVNILNNTIAFDVVPETWLRTNLGDLTTGRLVNLERALAISGRFEGHIVQGHVEGTGKVARCESPTVGADGAMLTIELPRELSPFVVAKGSIAIDGISLTVASVSGNACTIALIPETLRNTTLGAVKSGDRVNIETDILGRYIKTFLTRP